MSQTSQEKRQRWYDINPIVSDAMHAWEYFPLPLQQALAQHVNQMIKKGDVVLRYKGISSYIAKLLIMRDNGKSRRWYDKDKTIQNTINTLSMAQVGSLLELSVLILKLRTYINENEINVARSPNTELKRIIKYVFDNPNLI